MKGWSSDHPSWMLEGLLVMIVLVIDLLPKERSQLEWRQWSLSLTFLGGRCFQIDLLQSQPLHFDWVHRSSNKYNIMPLKLLTPKNHLSFPLILSNLSFQHNQSIFCIWWYKKLYCSIFWTHAILPLLILSTISNTERHPCFLAHLTASIAVARVPVLPIPALQCSSTSYFLSIKSTHSFTIFLNNC